MTETPPPLWRKSALLSALNAERQTVDFRHITGVSIDTRTIKKGDLFFALEGEGGNGHDYVEMALEKGAHAAVVSQTPRGFVDVYGAPLIRVPDTHEALKDLGKAARQRSTATRIAITGSVGKTSTRAIAEHVLSHFGATHASVKSYNNHIGVPLTLARMPQQTEYGIFEAGMNHAGELSELSRLIEPHIAMITEIAPAHIEHLGTLENIAKAKAEIFDGMQPGAIAIINVTTPFADLLVARAEAKGLSVLGYAMTGEVSALSTPPTATITPPIQTHKGLEFELEFDGDVMRKALKNKEKVAQERVPITTPLIGVHMAKNIAAVMTLARALGQGCEEASKVLQTVSLPEGRGVIKHYKLTTSDNTNDTISITAIDETYNANPASMRAALSVLSTFETPSHGKKWAVLGDMFELGHTADAEHCALKESILEADLDGVFLIGEKMRLLYDDLPKHLKLGYAETCADAELKFLQTLADGDVVMIKGSNGMRLARLFDVLEMARAP